jgi:hypothetical protein
MKTSLIFIALLLGACSTTHNTTVTTLEPVRGVGPMVRPEQPQHHHHLPAWCLFTFRF